MVSIGKYLSLSETAKSIQHVYTGPDDFESFYNGIDEDEKKSFLRHFIENNVPFAFKDKPILYERIIQAVADSLRIIPTSIKLVGSAKTGFSLSPSPDYGKTFGVHSDFDFLVINETVFDELEEEFLLWDDLYMRSKVLPNNSREEFFWNENIQLISKNIKKGFIDNHLIPNRPDFVRSREIAQCLYLVKENLRVIHNINVTKVSIRVYKDWSYFMKRIKSSVDLVINSL